MDLCILDCKGGMEATQAARWASQAWQLELATMDVLPSYALASVARDVLLTWVIQKGRVQNMDLQQQKCSGSGVPSSALAVRNTLVIQVLL